jgi:hypothetical protein
MHRIVCRSLLLALALGTMIVIQPPARSMAWTSPENLSVDTDATNWPDVAVGYDGKLHAVWTNTSTHQMMYSSRAFGGSWSTPEVVGTYAGTTLFMDGDITIAVVPDGTVHILYTDDSSGDSEIYHRSKPEGGVWSAPENISNTVGSRSDLPSMAVSADGGLHAAWIDAIPSNSVCCAETYYASKSAGGSWSPAVDVSNSGANEYPTRIGVGPDNSVHIVTAQEDGGPGRQNIYYYAKSPGGSFVAGVNLTGTADVGRGLGGVLKTADGVVHVAYYENSPGEVMYMSKPACGGWSSPLNLSNDASSSWDIDLTSDACGNLHIAWIDDGDGVQKVLYRGRTLSSAWTAPVDITGAAAGATTPRLAVAGPRGSTTGTVEVVFLNSPAGVADAFCTEAGLTSCGLPTVVAVQEPVGAEGLLPSGIRVAPNPSNGRVRLAARTAGTAATIAIYDVTGHLLRALPIPSGPESWIDVEWDGRDAAGHEAPAGIYWVQMDDGKRGTAARIVLVR